MNSRLGLSDCSLSHPRAAYSKLALITTSARSYGGVDWLNAPTALPALIVGVVTGAAPFFIMQPAIGSGIASSRAPKPNLARFRSFAAHVVFGFGLYISAIVVAFLSL